MHRKMFVAVAVAIAAAAGTASAQAQEVIVDRETPSQDVRTAPTDAVEITAGAGYTQGFGNIQSSSPRINDVSNAGIGFDLGVGYRLNPHVSVGVDGQYQEFSTSNTNVSSSRGFLGDVGATYHFMPYSQTSPWLRAATGYRMLWVNENRSVMYHGFDWLKLTVGLDIKGTRDVAIAPVIGADINTFFWRNGNNGNVTINDPRVNTYLFAGLQGRFDVGGTGVRQEAVYPAAAPLAKTLDKSVSPMSF